MRTADPRRRGGFTLVELMVALLITGLMVAAVLQLLNGQSRMVAVQSGKQEAQQNVRGALEVVSSELRSAIPGAILSADAQSVRFMQPRAWGVVCQVVGNVVTAVFPVTGSLDGWTVASANGVLINTGDLAAPVWRPDPFVPAARSRITAVQTLASPTTAPCGTMGAQGQAVAVQITTSAVLTGDPGDMIATYTLTQYDVGQDATGDWWLRRSNGLAANGTLDQQPMAGPLERERFAFTYFAGNPPVPVAAPGTNAVQLAALRMVGVQVVTLSSQRLNNRTQRDSGSVRVMLRN